MTFYWCKFGYGKLFGASSQSSHWAGHHRLSYKIHFSSHITIQLKNGSLLLCRIRQHLKMMIFFLFSVSSWGTQLSSISPLSHSLQMPHNHRMVDAEFFGNFSCSFKRISSDDALNWSLSPSNVWPLCFSSSRLSSPLQNFLNHHYTVYSFAVPGPSVLILQVVSTALRSILNSKKKIAQICFLS